MEKTRVEGAPKPADERWGLPSASGIARLKECPGSFHFIGKLAERGNLPAAAFPEEAQFGTWVHSAIEGMLAGKPKPPGCPDEAWDFAVKCQELVADTINQWDTANGGEKNVTSTEHRGWMRSSPGTPICSGQWDLAIISDKPGAPCLIIDWKSGFANTDEAADNWQLAALAAIASEEFGSMHVTVCIVQPRCTPKVTKAVYGASDLGNAVSAVRKAVLDALKLEGTERAPLMTGSHCRTCPAASRCPALRDVMLKLSGIEESSITTVPNSWLSSILALRSTIDRVLEQTAADALRRLKSGEKIPGIKLATRKNLVCTDVPGLAARVHVPEITLYREFGKLSWAQFRTHMERRLRDEEKGSKGKVTAYMLDLERMFTLASTTEYVRSSKT